MIELGFRADAIPLLKKYVDLLWSANTDLNLISRKMTTEELIDNHLIDCLLPLKQFPANVKQVADFGTGGGLPGVVYAIQFPQATFHLFEKSKLKQEFLTKCQTIAPNIKVAGDIPPTFGNVEIVIARAFKPIDVMLEMSRAYQAQGGKYFLLKGRREKIDEEIADAKKKFKAVEIKVEALKSPVLDVERHLVTI